MKNSSTLSQVTSSIINPSVISQVVGKLNGENITTIIVATIAAGTICYVCNNGGSLEFTSGDKKVVLNSSNKAA